MSRKHKSRKPLSVTNILFALLIIFTVLGVFLLIIHEHFGVERYHRLLSVFDLDGELNAPTFFSSLLFLLGALLLYVTGYREQYYASVPFFKLSGTWIWYFLTLVFIFFAIDESAQIHELLVFPLKMRYGLSGIFHHAWVVIGIPVVVFIAVTSWPLLKRLPKTVAKQMMIAGTVFISGSLGIEFLSGLYMDYEAYNLVTYKLLTVPEEFLEMLGLILFIRTLLIYNKVLVSPRKLDNRGEVR